MRHAARVGRSAYARAASPSERSTATSDAAGGTSASDARPPPPRRRGPTRRRQGLGSPAARRGVGLVAGHGEHPHGVDPRRLGSLLEDPSGMAHAASCSAHLCSAVMRTTLRDCGRDGRHAVAAGLAPARVPGSRRRGTSAPSSRTRCAAGRSATPPSTAAPTTRVFWSRATLLVTGAVPRRAVLPVRRPAGEAWGSAFHLGSLGGCSSSAARAWRRRTPTRRGGHRRRRPSSSRSPTSASARTARWAVSRGRTRTTSRVGVACSSRCSRRSSRGRAARARPRRPRAGDCCADAWRSSGPGRGPHGARRDDGRP